MLWLDLDAAAGLFLVLFRACCAQRKCNKGLTQNSQVHDILGECAGGSQDVCRTFYKKAKGLAGRSRDARTMIATTS